MAGPPFILPPGEPAEITAAECYGTTGGTPVFVSAWSTIPPGMTLGTFVGGLPTKLTGTPTTVGDYSLGGGIRDALGDIRTRVDVAVSVGAPPPPPPTFLPAPVGMKLLDRIEIVARSDGALVIAAAAHVGSATVGMTFDDGYNRMVASEQLRALIAPYDVNHLSHAVMWRGENYLIDGPPIVYRRGGRDHHITLKLKQPDAV